jgi:hypothetical protein
LAVNGEAENSLSSMSAVCARHLTAFVKPCSTGWPGIVRGRWCSIASPQLRTQIFKQLEERDCLQQAARVYFEWPKSETFALPSVSLQWLKQKSAGQVNYAIAEWHRSG